MTIPLQVAIVGDVSGLVKGLADGNASLGTFASALGAIPGPVGAIASAGVAVVGVLGDWTKAASEDATEQARLQAAVEASGAAHGDYAAQVQTAIDAGQALAFSDTEIRDALVPLVGATHDVGQANQLLATAQDVARLSGVSLETAAAAVAKAHDGNATSLAKLVDMNAKGKSATDILTAAQQKAAGQAEAYGTSTEGSMATANIAFSEVTETIGSAFLPILTEILPALIPIITSVGKLIGLLVPVLVPAIHVVAEALKIVVGVISGVVDILIKLVTWLGNAIGELGKFLDSINPLKGISLPSLPFTLAAPGGSSARMGLMPGGLGVGALSGRSGGGGGVTVNVYGGDPRRVTQAVQQGWRHWTDTNGADAPSREF
jgi:hypothetical protein